MRLNGLTVLRFISALWVFLFHFNSRIPIDTPYLVERVISNGALAMPIFFMLSGFVLAYKYSSSYSGFSQFFRARVARIYPAYFLGLILSIPFLWSQINLDIATILYLIPIDTLLLQAWYPNLWAFWHHAGTWSISVEFFLYAAFPLFLTLKNLRNRNLIAICVFCILLASSYIPSFKLGVSVDMPFAVYYSIPMYSLPVFIIGVILAELHSRGFQGLAIAPVLLVVLLGFAGQFNVRYAALNLFTIPLIALTLLFAARPPSHQGLFRFSINRYTVYLGDISYAFFVYQIPLLLWLDQNLQTAKELPVYFVGLIMLSINLIVAAISHRWIEPWGRNLIIRYWKN
jgi:peptidoglycan/LPS O-acetylase OafA/YrhL